MLDPMAKWTPAPDWETARLARGGITAHRVSGLSQILVSGDLEAALKFTVAANLAFVGLWQIAHGPGAAIRIARDRALLVASESIDTPFGWRDGFAATDASDAYAVLSLGGPALRDLVAEATTADVEAGGPSAAILFAAVPALLYRVAEEEARLHVEAGLAAYVWRWLETRHA